MSIKQISLFGFALLMASTFLQAQMKSHLIQQHRQQPPHSKLTPAQLGLNPLYATIPHKQSPTYQVPYQHQSISAQALLATSPRVKQLSRDGRPIWIKGQVSTEDIILPRHLSPSERKSYTYLHGVQDLLQISDPLEEFKLTKVHKAKNGDHHYRLQQYYRGIKVYGAEVILHERNEIINRLNGRSYPTPNLSNLYPNLTENQALTRVKLDISQRTRIIPIDPHLSLHSQPTTELVIFYPKDQPKQATLSWKVTFSPNLSSHWTYFLDAQTGEVLLSYDSVCKVYHPINLGDHVHNRHVHHNHPASTTNLPGPDITTVRDLSNTNQRINIYEENGVFYLLDISRAMFNAARSDLPSDPVGGIWTLSAAGTAPQNDDFSAVQVFTNNKNDWGDDRSGISAHFNAATAYEYYLNTHQRNSINGRGGNIISLINVAGEDGGEMDNAFWNGIAMFYGNGDRVFNAPLARALDVAGHEMTHGVIQAEANLDYIGQSGALNESFADVFGAMIDREDWQIGEDIVNNNIFRTGALRDMQNPNNGGTRFGNTGWQPAHLDEFVDLPLTEEGDNGGVHVNSGIPNRAFFLVASTIGRERAERIYYNALQNYLVRSSQFIDMRIAALEAAAEDFGQFEVNAVANAFDQVGIFSGEATDTQIEIEENEGEEFILFSDANNNVLKVGTPGGNFLQNPLTNIGPGNKPSVTDDGSTIVYVDQNNDIQVIILDPATGTVSNQFVLSQEAIWRNVAISKDGRRLAAITTDSDNLVYIFDLVSDPIRSSIFELSNPTTGEGIETGDVKFADVLEWNANGDLLIYDAFNEIETLDGAIEYWDIGFLSAWNPQRNDFGDGRITKLFTGLPEDVSVGNPTFAKNAPFVVAFDFIEEDFFETNYSLRTANIETGDVVTLFVNSILNFPNYSVDDRRIIFDAFSTSDQRVIGVIDLAEDRINPVLDAQAFVLLSDGSAGARWGVWYANGSRVLTSDESFQLDQQSLNIFPNPFTDQLQINFSGADLGTLRASLFDVMGKRIYQEILTNQLNNISLEAIPAGSYLMRLESESGAVHTQRVIKLE